MRRFVYMMLLAFVVGTLLGCAGQTKVEQAPAGEMTALAGLPDSVAMQSRKDAKETDTWKKFDKSGAVKFLQVEHTAPASVADTGAKLDGSYGERLIEVLIAPEVEGDVIEWVVENKGPSTIWIVATNKSDFSTPIVIEAKSSTELATDASEDYGYLVLDNEGGGETTVSVKATCGDTAAKTVRGKDMKVLWF